MRSRVIIRDSKNHFNRSPYTTTTMRRALAVAALLANACLAFANPFEKQLANGLRVIVKEDHRAPTAVHMVWYRAGSMDEYDGYSGLAHALEHMMFKGTKKLAAGESALTPLQILFVNLLTDGLPALALGMEPAAPGLMQRRPRPPRRVGGLVSARSLVPVAGIGGLIAVATLAAYGVGRAWEDAELAGHLAFATLVGSQLAASLVFRSESEAIFRLRRNAWLAGAIAVSLVTLLGAFYVPVLSAAFDAEPLSAGQWAVVAALSLIPLLGGEAAKLTRLTQRLNLLPEAP